jgi:ATP-dependent helicase/nuclease subunit A
VEKVPSQTVREAPVVFLPDSLRDVDHGPKVYIDRMADTASGCFLTKASSGDRAPKVIGIPPGWEKMKALEEKYAEAEEERLLYVATTGAKQLLVVSRYPSSPEKGVWKDLEPYLIDAKELGEPPVEFTDRKPGVVSKDGFELGWRRTEELLSRSRAASYAMDTVTGMTEAVAVEEPFSGDGGLGMKWGGMIHKALQVLANDESVDVDILATAS